MVLLCWTGLVLGQSSSESVDIREGTATATPAEDQPPPPGSALQLLRQKVARVNWDEAPFEDILTWLRDKGEDRVNIIPRWRTLAEEAVTQDSTVTLQLDNTTVAEVLNEVLEQLSADGRLRYRAIDNNITITTQADAERKMYLKVYHVTDVLLQIPNVTQDAPQIDLQNMNQGGGGGGGGGGGRGGQSVFSGGSGGGQGGQQQGETEEQLTQRLETLRKVIEETVAPESWNTQDGGGRGVVRVYNRALVVLNTIEVHEQLAGWFRLDR